MIKFIFTLSFLVGYLVLLTGCNTVRYAAVTKPDIAPAVKRVEVIREKIEVIKLDPKATDEIKVAAHRAEEEVKILQTELAVIVAKVDEMAVVANQNQRAAALFEQKYIHAESAIGKWRNLTLIFGGILCVQALVVAAYVYIKVVKPF